MCVCEGGCRRHLLNSLDRMTPPLMKFIEWTSIYRKFHIGSEKAQIITEIQVKSSARIDASTLLHLTAVPRGNVRIPKKGNKLKAEASFRTDNNDILIATSVNSEAIKASRFFLVATSSRFLISTTRVFSIKLRIHFE
nr:uncharacterized protein LOC118681837 [Bactrocera oleae]